MATQINWLKCTAAWGKEVAEDPSTSFGVLTHLAAHADINVRVAVADNRNSSLEAIMLLAQDGQLDLRYALAENHNIHANALNMLAEDDNPFVADRAKKTLARLAGRRDVQRSPSVSAEVIRLEKIRKAY